MSWIHSLWTLQLKQTEVHSDIRALYCLQRQSWSSTWRFLPFLDMKAAEVCFLDCQHPAALASARVDSAAGKRPGFLWSSAQNSHMKGVLWYDFGTRYVFHSLDHLSWDTGYCTLITRPANQGTQKDSWRVCWEQWITCLNVLSDRQILALAPDINKTRETSNYQNAEHDCTSCAQLIPEYPCRQQWSPICKIISLWPDESNCFSTC